MDRNANWERTRSAYDLIVHGIALHESGDPLSGLERAYERGENDEFVTATAIRSVDSGRVRVADGDVVVFANFRSDRARQLTSAFSDPAFAQFDRGSAPALCAFVTMTAYGDQFALPVAFPPVDLRNTFGDWIAALGLRLLRFAETV
jgi:2,3-bisphosphoglycerate-independent phosphoglycerate mutase